MLKTKTFDDVVSDIDRLDDSDLSGWFKLISGSYLTPSEMVILEAQAAQVESKAKQRELSVLYCVSQPYLSVKLRKLRHKIVSLYHLLRDPEIPAEYRRARGVLNAYQYFILSLILSGRVPREIAEITETTHVNANVCVNVVFRKIRDCKDLPALTGFIVKYKKNFN